MSPRKKTFVGFIFAVAIAQTASAAQTVKERSDVVAKAIQSPILQTSAVRQTPPDRFELGPGDLIRINAYQREDLSGKFSVRADGTVSVPAVGIVHAAGKTPSELEADFSAAIIKAMNRTVPISLEIDTWRPVYVVGDLDKPGVYPFNPGMTVLHALAAAGGFQRPLKDASSVEIHRQTTEIHRITGQLKLALSQEKRLLAEHSGQSSVLVPASLKKLAGPQEASRLIAAENSILRQNLQAQRDAIGAKKSEVDLSKREIAAHQQQRVEIKRRIKLISQELSNYSKLKAKGLARSPRLLQLRSEIAALESTSHNVMASIARSEKSLIKSTEEMNLLKTERRLEIEQQLQTLRGQISQYEGSLRLFADLTAKLVSSATEAPAENLTSYEIMRASSNRQTMTTAGETTQLKPGDVVRVKRTLSYR